jgi:hypothetical protein
VKDAYIFSGNSEPGSTGMNHGSMHTAGHSSARITFLETPVGASLGEALLPLLGCSSNLYLQWLLPRAPQLAL